VPDAVKADAEAPDELDPTLLGARLVVKFSHTGAFQSALQTNPELKNLLFRNVEPPGAPITPEMALRNALVASDLLGLEEANKRLDAIKTEDARLQSDIEIARAVLRPGPDGAASVDPAALASWRTRLGYIAKVVLTRDRPATDPERASLLGGGETLMAMLFLAGMVGVVAVVGGITCCIIACVKLSNRGLARGFVPPMPGGSVFVETFAIFVLAYLALHTLPTLIGMAFNWHPDEKTFLTVRLFAQWLLLPVIFWPVLRGLTFREWRERVGWTAGKGVLREMAAGVFGYLAFLPVLLVVGIVARLLYELQELLLNTRKGLPPGAPSNPLKDNPILELVLHASPGQLVLFYVLATCWAPIVEEAIFRGSVFRDLRARWALRLAGPVSALFFGLMHGYAGVLLLPVIAIGASLAIIREWRGSLIACMTAHAVHNAVILALTIGILRTLLN
jgi:membrane protease YdiL (CAAX protease family)